VPNARHCKSEGEALRDAQFLAGCFVTVAASSTRLRDRLTFDCIATFIVIAISCSIASSCRRAGVGGSPKRIKAIYNNHTNRLEQLMYDSNGNGKIDMWSHMDGTRVLWVEIDKNEDDVIDRWEYYGPDQKLLKVGYATANDGKVNAWEFRNADGSLMRIEFSSTNDVARINRTEFYERGALVRAEEDSNADGRVDKWEIYAGSSLASVAYDTRFRGVPDRRLFYGRGGKLERIEADPDGDGSFASVPLER
jgi:hypothetical protein